MRNTMRMALAALLGAATLGAAHAAQSTPPVSSTAGPVEQNSAAMMAADANPMGKMSIRQQIADQLGKAGYKDVKVIPSSFLVRATDPKGNPVEMVMGPDSLMTVTEIPVKGADATAPSTPAK